MSLKTGDWRGLNVLVVGGGPSLRDFDWDRTKNWPEWSPLVAINRAAEFVRREPLHFSIDAAYWRKAPFRYSGAKTVWVDTGDKRPDVHEVIKCAAAGPNKGSELVWGRSLEEGIGCGGHSGFAALNLADALGAMTVYLLGFDMRGEAGTTANFHSGYTHTKPASSVLYERYLESFRWAAERVRAEVVVLEAVPGSSAVDCWEKRPVGDVL